MHLIEALLCRHGLLVMLVLVLSFHPLTSEEIKRTNGKLNDSNFDKN